MRVLCWFGLHRWQMLTEWCEWIDVELPLRNFDATLHCARCKRKKRFHQVHD